MEIRVIIKSINLKIQTVNESIIDQDWEFSFRMKSYHFAFDF